MTNTTDQATAVVDAEPTEQINIKRFLESVRLDTNLTNPPVPMLQDNFESINEDVSDEDRFMSGLGALLYNVEIDEQGRLDKGKIQDLIAQIDTMVNDQLNEVIHNPKFQELESSWTALFDLLKSTNFRANVMIDLLDVSKSELQEDFENNAVDFTGSALFQKVYVAEYDQFGGKPVGSMVGMYEFEHSPKDEFWLKTMGKIANASHSPFISSVSPKFFGCDTIEELASIKDLEGMMNHPKYGSWNALRDSEESAYIGLTLPRYILRLPYDPVTNPVDGLNFKEYTWGDESNKYLWGNASILFAKNLVRSFETSGWCQYLRGPKAGGLVSGLPVHTFNLRGEEEIKLPVEMTIPDYRELEFANSGFMPLIYRKGTADACFFSCQSLKKPKTFKDPKDSENAQLICNLSYTFSITRIAHYIKSIMRDNIGSTADGAYIQNLLQTWLMQFVTTVSNPDDVTLKYYPFKAAEVQVEEREGMIGWYHCSVAILPHIQFEGMDVELKLESRLG